MRKVAITLRGSISASVNEWAGMLYSDGECYFHITSQPTVLFADNLVWADMESVFTWHVCL